MPLIAHNGLPTYERLRQEGRVVISKEQALHQDIRELHIGILNMMPDAALEATERQFCRLIGESNAIAQIHVHMFTLPELERKQAAVEHIEKHYSTFAELQEKGLDALIVTGANVSMSSLKDEVFWQPLSKVIEWAEMSVASTLFSCLSTHAAIELRFGEKRHKIDSKYWGVFKNRVVDNSHPLVSQINTTFCMPHSRWNNISREQFDQSGLRVLVESEDVGVSLATSKDGVSSIYMQGHPEYDTYSLLKEYKREVFLYFMGNREGYPEFPEAYFNIQSQAILDEYKEKIECCRNNDLEKPEFPEAILMLKLENTWNDTGKSIISKWLGLVYQYTNIDRKKTPNRLP